MVISSSSSSKTTRPFLLPIIILLIIIFCSAAFSAADDEDNVNVDKHSDDHYLDSQCSGTNSDYSQNLTSLLVDDLANNISPAGNGSFSKASRPWAQDQVYALAQCRGDVSGDECKKCVTVAGNSVIKTYCPNKQSATIWNDHCEVKYSDFDFFGKIDTDNNLTMTNGMGLATGSIEPAKTFLSSLSQTAVESPGYFARGELPATETAPQSLYGAVQCTADLSGGDCKACLDRAVSDLSKCCGTFSGARVNFGSCNVRRETYPFLI